MKRVTLGLIGLGAAIGALNLAHYHATKLIPGVQTPFGLFPGGFPVATFMGLTGRRLSPDLAAMMVLGFGVVGGSALGAWRSGDLTITKIRAKKLPALKIIRAGIGGVLMGVGTWMAGGCLIKHTLSGAPGLMLSSFVTLAGIMVGIRISALAQDRWA